MDSLENKKVRIGCASAFYGDSQLAARQLVDKGEIDYLVFDYLAEATMAILARAKAKDTSLGYAVDFVTVAMRGVLADCAKKGIKIIANAGGVNVPACIDALEALSNELGLSLKISGVYGDDLSGRVAEFATADLTEAQSGKALPKKLASINAYLGAEPIADALTAGADIVVTGRIVDSAVTLAPLIYEFGWDMRDYDRLAQGSLAGHVIECGAQCTGGNFTDWHLVPDFSDMSYPIAEVSKDGSFDICIPPGTGGMVTRFTVGEQILYEIGDPANYLLPDVACDFSAVELTQIAPDVVRVTGAKGRAPGPNYKVCATYMDGYRLLGSFYIAGPRSLDKAEASLNAWISRTETYFKNNDIRPYSNVSLEYVGAEHAYGAHAYGTATREVMAKFGVHHESRAALSFAAAELAYLATSASPGMSGMGGGRARPQPLMRVHSCFIDKDAIDVTVQLGDENIAAKCYAVPDVSKPAHSPEFIAEAVASEPHVAVPLEMIACNRSGDKGDNANIGVMARKPEYLDVIADQVTEESVADYFSHLVSGTVTRFYVPGFSAFNFLLTEALGGGGTASIRLDGQGKAYGQMLLSMTVKVPVSWGLHGTD